MTSHPCSYKLKVPFEIFQISFTWKILNLVRVCMWIVNIHSNIDFHLLIDNNNLIQSAYIRNRNLARNGKLKVFMTSWIAHHQHVSYDVRWYKNVFKFLKIDIWICKLIFSFKHLNFKFFVNSYHSFWRNVFLLLFNLTFLIHSYVSIKKSIFKIIILIYLSVRRI